MENVAAKAVAKLNSKVANWQREDAEAEFALAEAKMQIAKAKLSGNVEQQLSATLAYKIEEHLAKLKKEGVPYFTRRVFIPTKELPMENKEQCQALIPTVAAATGLKLALTWQCTCCWADTDHDSSCGEVLSAEF